MHLGRTIEQIERLRSREAARHAGSHAGDAFVALGRTLARDARRAGGAGDAWIAVCPEDFADRTGVVSLSRGTLTIGVADHATLYRLDRALRGGLERQVIAAASAPIRRVKLVVRPGLAGGGAGGSQDRPRGSR